MTALRHCLVKILGLNGGKSILSFLTWCWECAEKTRPSSQAGGRQSLFPTARCHGSSGAYLSWWVPINWSSWQGPGWATRDLFLPCLQRLGVPRAPFRCVQIEGQWRMCALQAHVAALGTPFSDVHFARLVVQSASVPVLPSLHSLKGTLSTSLRCLPGLGYNFEVL